MDIQSLLVGYSRGRLSVSAPVLTELTVTENGIYKASEYGGGESTVTFDQNYSFVQAVNSSMNDYKNALIINADIPPLDVSTIDFTNHTADLTPYKNWSYSVTSESFNVDINGSDEFPVLMADDLRAFFTFAGAILLIDERGRELALMVPSNMEEIMVAMNTPAEAISQILQSMPPNTLILYDISEITTEYEVVFKYNFSGSSGEVIDGFSEVVVNVPSSGGGGNADLRTLEVTKNGTYKASENIGGGRSSITFNQDYADFVEVDGISCVQVPNAVPAIEYTISGSSFNADESFLRKDWSYTITDSSSGDSLIFNAEELPLDFFGELTIDIVPFDIPGVFVLQAKEDASVKIAMFMAANLEEIFTDAGAPSDVMAELLATFKPGYAYLYDPDWLGVSSYEATFEYGTPVADPCDGYSEITVNVQPKTQEKSKTFTTSGVTEILPDEGKYLSKVTITIPADAVDPEKALRDFVNDDTWDMLPIPSGVSDLRNYLCYGYDIRRVVIPKDVESIGMRAFAQCAQLYSVIFEEDSGAPQLSLHDYAFENCTSLTDITIPSRVSYMGNSVFRGCTALKTVDLKCTSLSSIQMHSFNGCKALTSINIPNTVTSIGNNAFTSCSSLETITIPSSVTNIALEAFSQCTNLKVMVYEGTYSEFQEKVSLGSKWHWNAGGGTMILRCTDQDIEYNTGY